jgi:hypothetical protein
MKDNECLKVGKKGCEFFSINKKGISICKDCGVAIQNVFNCGIADGSFGDVKEKGELANAS